MAADEQPLYEHSNSISSGIPRTFFGERRWIRKYRESFRSERPVYIVTAAILANGLVSILKVLLTRFPKHQDLFGLLLPFGLLHVNRTLNLILGFMLIYLALRLHQRHRVAWWIAVFASMAAIFTHLVQRQVWLTAVSPMVTLTLLLVFRRRFMVRTQQRSILQGVALVGLCTIIAVSYGTAGFMLLDTHDFGRNFAFSEALVRTLREYSTVGNTGLIASSRHAIWFIHSLHVLGIMAAIFGAYSLFHPVVYRIVSLPSERVSARKIIDKWGRSSYDYFKAWHDKSFFFSDSGMSFVSYRYARGVAVCLGDPVGPENEKEEIISSFLHFCTDNGWTVALLMPESIPLYRKLGFTIMKIGEGAVVDLERFCEITAQKKYFRYIRRKLEKDGFSMIRHKPPHPHSLIEEVEEVSREWLGMPGHREIEFIQGSFDRAYVAATNLCILRDGTGKVIAFVNEVPSYRPGEATIDMMRHRQDVHWGAMDYIFQGLMQILRQEGKRTFYLGMAGVTEKPEKGFADKAFYQLTKHLNWVIRSRGVRQFKEKFEPVWEDRYLVFYGSPLSLAKIALAVMRVL